MDASGTTGRPVRHYRAILRKTVAVTATTKHLDLEIIDGGAFEYVAGQFVSMTLPHDGATLTRAYSIASPPRHDNRLDLCLNRVPNGVFSNHLCDLVAGATVEFSGPYGLFTIPLPVTRPQLLVATGTGIAPIRSMVSDLFARGLDAGHEVTLLFGVRHRETLLYADEFQALAARYPGFLFEPTLSRPPTDWRGRVGYVQHHLQEILAARNDVTAYVCGLKAMVDEVRSVLRSEAGLDRHQIRYEQYD